tara:strand:- start:1956 stop:2114 length:159 start_codon:yes stop_codon:yes gene_type:complete
MRLKISYCPKKKYYVTAQPKLFGDTKQLLFKIIKEELDVKKIHIRRNNIVCT